MDKIYKVFDSEVKKVGERQYEFTASDSSIDRDNEIIDVNGWDLKNFKKNPVIMYAHDYSTLPIGKATRIGVKDNKLVNVVEFPPEGTYEFADTVQRLVDTGYLKTQSVGFVPKTWEDGNGKEGSANRTYTKQELLEISIVPVPSNPNALRNAVKEGVITQKQLEGITKVEEKKPSRTSQEEIKDQIDYLQLIINEDGLNDESIVAALDLIETIQNLTSIRVITCPHCGGERMDVVDDDFVCCECGKVVKRFSLEVKTGEMLEQDVVQETTLPVKDTTLVKEYSEEQIKHIISETIKNVIKEL
jgi:HK97 family phage prohead protease